MFSIPIQRRWYTSKVVSASGFHFRMDQGFHSGFSSTQGRGTGNLHIDFGRWVSVCPVEMPAYSGDILDIAGPASLQ